MATRTKRVFSDYDIAGLLKDLENWRSRCVAICAKAPINGEVYKLATKLMTDIDDAVEILTGDRKRFHVKPHSAQ